ncbi:MAG: diguanylate cyclase [Bacilli bacterium]|nr:diguanylate cyclase [Bacilli bacterium]
MQKKNRFPLWLKTLLILAASVAIVSVVAVVFSTSTLVNITRSHYIQHSTEVADTYGLYLNLDDVKSIASKVQERYATIPEEKKVSNSEWGNPEWEAYLANYSDIVESEEYARLLKQTEEFHSKNDAKYIYISYADFDEKRLIYLVDDSPIEDRCLPGSFDEFTESDMSITEHLEEGFAPEVTDTPEYGHLVSVGRPIFDENNNVVAFAMVELSMDEIIAKEQTETRKLALILGALAIAATIIGYFSVLVAIIRPIRKLTKVANEYTAGTDGELNKFSKVEIHTMDEIEDLSNSMKKMEGELNHYIVDLVGAQRKVDEMRHLADIDAMTGIGNKRAYFEREEELNAKIKEGKTRFSVIMIDLNDLKLTNDTMGHEEGDKAIVALGNVIKESFSDSTFYRIGGDEFVIICEDEQADRAPSLIRNFKAAMARLPASEKGHKITAAIGVATYDPKVDNNVEDAFNRADKNMYKNKKAIKKSAANK